MTPEQMRRAADIVQWIAVFNPTLKHPSQDEAATLARLLRERAEADELRQQYAAHGVPTPDECAALQAGAQGWRPIETAPRDGTRILLWRDWLTLDDRAVCYWHGDLRNWYAVGQYVFNGALLWQPLPPPPGGGK